MDHKKKGKVLHFSASNHGFCTLIVYMCLAQFFPPLHYFVAADSLSKYIHNIAKVLIYIEI